MADNKAVDILKQAILLEKRGNNFYRTVAQQAKSESVKNFFNEMAEEELVHIKYLSTQFAEYMKSGKFDLESAENIENPAHEEILTDDLKRDIEAASFEAAAITSALDFEKRAVALYSERAKSADTEEERKIYEHLAKWEEGHLDILDEISKELTEKIWDDNSFWPY